MPIANELQGYSNNNHCRYNPEDGGREKRACKCVGCSIASEQKKKAGQSIGGSGGVWMSIVRNGWWMKKVGEREGLGFVKVRCVRRDERVAAWLARGCKLSSRRLELFRNERVRGNRARGAWQHARATMLLIVSTWVVSLSLSLSLSLPISLYLPLSISLSLSLLHYLWPLSSSFSISS